MNTAAIDDIFDRARRDNRDVLLETEGLAFLDALHLPVPAHVFVRGSDEVAPNALETLPGERVVVKVISPQILHKSDVGGVVIVEKHVGHVGRVIAGMQARLGKRGVVGYSISEFVSYPAALGHELIVGLRWTDAVGPVVTVGAGGIHTEFLAHHFRPERDLAVLSPDLATPTSAVEALNEVAVIQLATRPMRGRPPAIALDRLARATEVFLALGRARGDRIAECEVNPLVIATDGRLVALDILVKLRPTTVHIESGARPVAKLKHLLQPRSAAIMGVSERLNPGHIIVNNLIREGFDRSRIYVVKTGSAFIEGCRCVPDVASLPERVDMFVLAIDAAQASAALVEIIERASAESVVLIPGGFEEKAGTETIVRRMQDALAEARHSAWGGPVINGGNCLGIRSRPGHYDTTFIPEYKLPVPSGATAPVAIIAQSGAFAVAKASKLGTLSPKYFITLGNQMDLTVGDYLTYLKDDDEIDVFAVYVEGFRPLDGLRFLKAASDISAQGRTVILYLAGRTPAGAKASASHTASIAGDYVVMRALCTSAGVVVADSLDDFEDLTRLFMYLGHTTVAGWKLAAISNAGFECVAIADNLGGFSLPPFGQATGRRLHDIFVHARIDQVVDVHNPIDLTPMAGDEAFAQVVEAVLDDEAFDAAVVGCVPLTGALNTLPPGDGHGEDLMRDDSLVERLRALRGRSRRPWMAVVDAGPLYDPMAHRLVEVGIPTFRSADRALRLLNAFCAQRIRFARESGARIEDSG